MSQRICLTLLISLVVWINAAGQSGSLTPNPVAFNMIRATTEFLATDTKAFGNRATIPCSPCQSYDDLYQFVRQNKLLKADELITDARNVANQALQADSTQMPDKLRSFLIRRVTAGDRAYRASLPAYEPFVRSLGASAAAAATPLAEAGSVPEAGDLEPLVDSPDTTEAYTETSSTELTDPTTNAFSVMDYLPLLLSILSLAGVVILWFRKPAAASSPLTILPEDTLNKLENRVRELEKDNRQLKDSLIALRQSADAYRPSASQPQPQPANRPITQTTTAAARPVSQPVQPVMASAPTPRVTPQPQTAAPTLLYGRTADLGDGFSAKGLSDKPDRDTIFEILRTDPNRAEFKVSDNSDLQRLALSDAYSYLNDTCTYATQPRPGNRIRTEKPGLLSLQGEKWVIVEKAQISFLG